MRPFHRHIWRITDRKHVDRYPGNVAKLDAPVEVIQRVLIGYWIYEYTCACGSQKAEVVE